MNEQQLKAVDARGEVFVSAGAGTGKTRVLVERFVRAVCDEGLDVQSVLVITYTNKAAGELRSRIRAELGRRGRLDLAQELDGAWVSTIHGFCLRLLRAHPFAVGIDPRFRALDEEQGAVLRGEAFGRALEKFLATRAADRLRLVATTGSQQLRRNLVSLYEKLRSSGRPLVIETWSEPDLSATLDAFRDAAQCLLDDTAATANQQAAARGALELPADPERLVDLKALRARGARAASYEETRTELAAAALSVVLLRERVLLQELLGLFALEYADGKERESALDFEDLQLYARDLLANDDRIREAEQLRFRAIMVDEFQDTNALQCELIDLLAGGVQKDVFFVGDEFQSIYSFRHADVEVFRARREAASQRLPLTENYRSRPEVLAAVNYLFGSSFGDGYQPLHASSEFPDPVFGHPVELLVTDKQSYSGSGLHWRRAEARHVARRVRELVDAGAATPGEIVLLFAAGTDAEWYEEELRALGLPTFRATGRRYFGQQQVVDLRMYLRLLRNRYDDEALVAVLASPFVGVSNDALVLLRRHAGRRPLFTGLERSLPEAIDAGDERLFRAFKQRYERLVAASARVSLERLCELVVSEHDYDLAVLARWDGQRRYANLRKLMRLARAYEELRGRDLEGFLGFISDQEAAGAAQHEAVSEEEGADAVRLLTIHAAKGLEFKVVVVADAGREKAGADASDEYVLSKADDDERLRLYYVAMTRAVDRLIVSGAVGEGRETPISWILGKLDCAEELAGEHEQFELDRGDAIFLVRLDRCDEQRAPDAEAPETEVESGDQLALFGELPAEPAPRGYELPELVPVPPAPLHRVRTLSYSALALYERCSYRYYAERLAGLRERRQSGGGGEGGGLAATELGDAVHRLLEHPETDVTAVREWYPLVTDADLERIGVHVDAYRGSELAARAAGARPELSFAFEHDGVLIHGRFDLFRRDGARALVVDYKTNALGDRDPADVVETEYSLQRLVYALACFRAGADEVEVVYAFLERPDAPVSRVFRAGDAAELKSRLSLAITRIDDGDFVPSPSDFACSDCPALDVVCAGPRLRRSETAREPVPAA
ncbi:MAG TPA: UvrD-helicase domain-containing protein [Gaiellaceae bacterium]